MEFHDSQIIEYHHKRHVGLLFIFYLKLPPVKETETLWLFMYMLVEEYCTISINSAWGVTRDLLAEIVSPAKGCVTWDMARISAIAKISRDSHLEVGFT
jgi:hypothetical protein